ncbi:MAG: ThuA domain-containing protein, partial [Planctomycetota bacterium]|nr:ThuA domain-containing protein [Planctomycetota bacterium]
MIEVLFTIILSIGFTAGFEPDRSSLDVEVGHRDTRLQSILVFSKTAGFRHGSIQPGQKAITAIGQKHGFRV